jgi:hypothetical protein
MEVAHAPAKRSRRLLRIAVDGYLTNLAPGAMRLVRRALPPAENDDLMPALDQARHQIGSDVTTAANHDNAHLNTSRFTVS